MEKVFPPITTNHSGWMDGCMDGWIVCGTGNIFFIGFQFSMGKKNVMFPITNHNGWMDGWVGKWTGLNHFFHWEKTSSFQWKNHFLQSLTIMDEWMDGWTEKHVFSIGFKCPMEKIVVSRHKCRAAKHELCGCQCAEDLTETNPNPNPSSVHLLAYAMYTKATIIRMSGI